MQQNQLTPQIALNNLKTIAENARCTASEHKILSDSVAVLQELVVRHESQQQGDEKPA